MQAKKPADCDRLFGEYAGKGDLKGLLSLYEEECTFVRADRSVHTGLAEVRKILASVAERRPRITMNVFKVVRVGDLAMLYNDWTMTTNASDGSSTEATHKAIELVRRQADGSWRFVLDDPFAREQ
jgi:uncharacterized protein (TIGR02246 family)